MFLAFGNISNLLVDKYPIQKHLDIFEIIVVLKNC